MHRGYLVGIGACALALVWFLSGPTRTPLHRGIGVGEITIIYSIATWAMWRCSRRAQLPEAFGRGMRWLAAAMALAALGGAYVMVDAFLDPATNATFNLSDLLFLATYPVIVVGLLIMPRVRHPSVGRWRLAVDSLVFTVGCGLPLWFFAVRPGLATTTGYNAVMTVVYPLTSFVGIGILNAVFLTRMPLPSRRAFRLVLTAIAVSWLADLLYILDTVYGYTGVGMINWTDVTDILSAALIIFASGRIETDEVERPDVARPAASSPLPVLALVLVNAWMLLFIERGHPSSDSMLHIVWGVGFMFVALAGREVFIARDSARWFAAEVERESRERFASLVEHSLDVIMVVDAGGVIRFASPAALGALGRIGDAIEGQALVELVHPEDRAKGAAFLGRLAEPAAPPQTAVWRLQHADGTYRFFETIGSNRLADEAVRGIVVNSRDITDRILIEERLRQSQKFEAIGQLVGGIAHNYNNILTSTIMRLGLLLDDKSLPQNVKKEIEMLDRGAKRTADLTKKLTMFGQQQFLRKGRMDLRKSVTTLAPEIQRLMGPGVALRLEIGAAQHWVEADPGLVDQIVLSLSANAHDAMKDGGTLSIGLESVNAANLPAPSDGEARSGHYVKMSFTDNGCGMDEAVRRRLFEPFFTTKGPNIGLGLGLASVHGIVKQHGGWMEVRSAVGFGSTFDVFLPCLQGAPTPAPGA